MRLASRDERGRGACRRLNDSDPVKLASAVLLLAPLPLLAPPPPPPPPLGVVRLVKGLCVASLTSTWSVRARGLHARARSATAARTHTHAASSELRHTPATRHSIHAD